MVKSKIIMAGFTEGRAFELRRLLFYYSHDYGFKEGYTVCRDQTEAADSCKISSDTVVIFNCEQDTRRAAAGYFLLRGAGCYVVFYSAEHIRSRPLVDFKDDYNTNYLIAPADDGTMQNFAEKYLKRENFLSDRAKKIFSAKNFKAVRDLSRLSYTERSYLYYLAAGRTEGEMKTLMNCGKTSLDSYRNRLFEKTGVSSKADLLYLITM